MYFSLYIIVVPSLSIWECLEQVEELEMTHGIQKAEFKIRNI